MRRQSELRSELLQQLSREYGQLVGGNALRKLLGFPSSAAMKQAIARNTLTLQTFFIEGRRGRFALTADVAEWLIVTKATGVAQEKKDIPKNFCR